MVVTCIVAATLPGHVNSNLIHHAVILHMLWNSLTVVLGMIVRVVRVLALDNIVRIYFHLDIFLNSLNTIGLFVL